MKKKVFYYSVVIIIVQKSKDVHSIGYDLNYIFPSIGTELFISMDVALCSLAWTNKV